MTIHRTIARYTVKPGQEELNTELVRAVYRELAEQAPAGFTYNTYRLHDERTFVHVAEREGDAPVPLTQLAAFRAFQDGIEERCEWGPVVGSAESVGHYGG
jgi:hypothetical protein